MSQSRSDTPLCASSVPHCSKRYSITHNNANICVQAIEQVPSLLTAEKISCTIWRPISPRYGRRVVRPAELHANTIRPAQSEDHPGAAFSPPHTFFTPPFKVHNHGQMSREEELGLNKNRKKFDVREAYFVSPTPFLKTSFDTNLW